jgi:hypothetical protein
MYFSRCLFAGALGLACAGVHAEDAAVSAPAEKSESENLTPTIEKIDIRPGDRWSYRVVDEIIGETKYDVTYTITEIDNSIISVSVEFNNYRQGSANTILQTYDDRWNFLGGPIWRIRPGDPSYGVSLPLKVGLEWKTHFTATRNDRDIYSIADATTRVTAYEPVTLKFNYTYNAFKIDTEESISTGVDRSVTKLKTTSWYAPEVNRYVKRITETRIDGRLLSRTSEQLTAYTRRNDN